MVTSLRIVLPVLSVVLCASFVLGKAAFMSKEEMIHNAEVIAVVEITAIDKTVTKGIDWTFAQKATAKVETLIKGKLPETVALYGDQDFICARCHFEVGKYLVFLKRDNTVYTGNNWQLSIRKITGAKVEWFDGDKTLEKSDALLADVLKEIPVIMAKAATPTTSK
ncbi:MAG: hypothetical protein WCT04_22630 [Planctomycetota bacterium]